MPSPYVHPTSELCDAYVNTIYVAFVIVTSTSELFCAKSVIFTIYETSGYYIHQDKSVSIEKSLKIEIMFVELETIKAIIEQLKKVLNQESIILQTEKIKSELV